MILTKILAILFYVCFYKYSKRKRWKKSAVSKAVKPQACNFIKKETLAQVLFAKFHNTSGGCFWK